jgi:hypothetical protein
VRRKKPHEGAKKRTREQKNAMNSKKQQKTQKTQKTNKSFIDPKKTFLSVPYWQWRKYPTVNTPTGVLQIYGDVSRMM